ncbi:MAG: aminotransferase class III-fold pyridoxal phosphate-dependent enzyme [Flavobacteriaceae bacterium]
MNNTVNENHSIRHWVAKLFAIESISIAPLAGYDNKNYLLTTSKEAFIVKTYADSTQKALLEEESIVLSSLSLDLETPFPKKSLQGNYVEQFTHEGKKELLRVLSFVKGSFMKDLPPTKALYRSLGQQTAFMGLALQEMQRPLLQCREWEWNLNASKLLLKRLDFIQEGTVQGVVRYFIQQFEQRVLPQQEELPQQLLHNDLNEYNLLAKGKKVTGCIDFGDLAYGPRIYELAIAMVYASYDKEAPLEWAGAVLEGYVEERDINELEISLLYYIMAMRLCMSLCNAAFATTKNPENDYVNASVQHAQKMLFYWLSIGPVKAERRFLRCSGKPLPVLPSIAALTHQRGSFFSGALSLSYAEPLHLTSAALQYMYASDGSAFLDAYNNIPHVGHNHPLVVEAAQKQLATLNTNTRYLYDPLHHYAERLLSYFPPELNRVFFVNSGSEASDLAIRMARYCTEKEKVAVVAHGYHGHTQTGIEISDYKFSHPKGIGQSENIIKLPLFAGEEGLSLDQKQQLYGALNEPNLAAFISESILGCAGQVPLAKDYLATVYSRVREKGGLCIADEVQTGFGRTGSHFWAYEAYGVIPDMVLLGKPMGNGHPMGAVVCSQAIADGFSQGVEFFSSFGGNPVSCVTGLAVLDVMEKERLQENALLTGKYYQAELNRLKEKYSCITDVRGAGLFLGVELSDSQGKPNTNLARRLKNYLRENTVLISTDGPKNNVLKSKPPLCFTKENVDRVIAVLDEGIDCLQA